MAWLDSIPEEKSEPRRESVKLDMPEVNHYGYLIDYLHELGVAGKDVTPISFTELKAWCDLMGLSLTPFENSTIIKLSVSYCNMWYAARKEIPAPYMSESDIQKQNAASLESFKRFAKK